MGSSNSTLQDILGNPINNRKCIILLTPPSFETSKLLSEFPAQFSYKFISVGQLIRDELNKKTRYSQMIMENLEKDKKINDKILQILLKNTALQTNFMIQFCPKDNKDLVIWQQFIKKITLAAVVIIQPDKKNNDIPTTNQVKQLYAAKLKEHQRNVTRINQIVDKQFIHVFNSDEHSLVPKILSIVEPKAIKK